MKKTCHNQRYLLVPSIPNFGNIFIYFHNVFIISSSKLNRQNVKSLMIVSINDLSCQWRKILFLFALICITCRAITPFNMDEINWTTTSGQTFICICFHNPFQLWYCLQQWDVFISNRVHFLNKCMEEPMMLGSEDVYVVIYCLEQHSQSDNVEAWHDEKFSFNFQDGFFIAMLCQFNPPSGEE